MIKQHLITDVCTKLIVAYGLLSINHAYNEGKIPYWDRLKLSREWAEQIFRQNKKAE